MKQVFSVFLSCFRKKAPIMQFQNIDAVYELILNTINTSIDIKNQAR